MAHGIRGMLEASLIKECMGVHQKMAQPPKSKTWQAPEPCCTPQSTHSGVAVTKYLCAGSEAHTVV